MPKKIVKTIELFRFMELSEEAKERAVAAEIEDRMTFYSNVPEKQYSGDTIAALGFDINFSHTTWSGITWTDYEFTWDDYNLAWNGSYKWNPNWREDYAKAPYFGREDKPSLLEFGEALEALQVKHDYKLRAKTTYHTNDYYGHDFASIDFVDEEDEEIETTHPEENPHYELDKARWDRWNSSYYGGPGPMPKSPQKLLWIEAPDMTKFKEILKGLARWWRRQLQEHWEGEQDPEYVASVLADYNDKWFYENGVEADEEPDDEDED